MRLVGLTGGIATGKSTVAEMFRQLGATLIDSDLLAREAVAPGGPAYLKVIERFGRDVLRSDGYIDREKLGRIVFNDDAARRDLNIITHPKVFELMMKRIEEAEKEGAEVVMVDIPLFFEVGGIPWLKTVILVWADPETQLRRLIERDRCDEEAARSRINSQMPIADKKEKAQIVIDNAGDMENTRRQVLHVWEQIRRE